MDGCRDSLINVVLTKPFLSISSAMVTTHCSHYRTISLIAHTATLAARILRREFERKIEEVLGKDQLDLEEEKAVEMQL